MGRVRKIYRHLQNHQRNYFLVDACFLANRHIPLGAVPSSQPPKQTTDLRRCKEWWNEIDAQLRDDKARVFVPDVCIAEAFKVLAKRYYHPDEKWLTYVQFNEARKRLIKDVHIPVDALKRMKRKIAFHDISTTRDIIIAVDRFYEIFMKKKKSVQIVDLILVATAKYLMEFYDVKRAFLHIITLDTALRQGAQGISEIPYVYNPSLTKDAASKIFTDLPRSKRKAPRRRAKTSHVQSPAGKSRGTTMSGASGAPVARQAALPRTGAP